jgi:hypothetical protein
MSVTASAAKHWRGASRAEDRKYSETAALGPFALSGNVPMTLFDDLVATASIACQP